MGEFRDYMREDYPRERTSVLTWLICALVASFILQNVLVRWFSGDALVAQYLALSPSAIIHFRVWTLLSHALIHDPNNLLHILFVIVGLYFIGRDVLNTIQAKHFLTLIGLSVLGGGLAWLGVHYTQGGYLFGAAAAVSGVFYMFACLNPDRPITFLLLFIFPVTLPKTKYLAYAVALIDIFGFAFYELGSGGSAMANSAHLGGMIVGLAYYRFIYRRPSLRWPFSFGHTKAEVIPPHWANNKAGSSSYAAFTVNMSDRDRLRAEVDRILDKINSKGFGALSTEEKHTLDEARDLLNKR